ncbi:Cytochrome P450 4c3 [Araneus ventricosus]|uniref:Cytochrome P450 4c3 n=1 Tax=Araneus ventricosus TaxID=182803 RepID=A0A4Y2EGV9_ARAVE|nr:Cytochrome P450 4c3 [Araneus ventricosus]
MHYDNRAFGHETVSAAIAWALYLIGLHSDVQMKLHEELDKVFGEDTKQPASERDLSDLQYLDCVIKETNRLYPTAPVFGRGIQEDTNIYYSKIIVRHKYRLSDPTVRVHHSLASTLIDQVVLSCHSPTDIPF